MRLSVQLGTPRSGASGRCASLLGRLQIHLGAARDAVDNGAAGGVVLMFELLLRGVPLCLPDAYPMPTPWWARLVHRCRR